MSPGEFEKNIEPPGIKWTNSMALQKGVFIVAGLMVDIAHQFLITIIVSSTLLDTVIFFNVRRREAFTHELKVRIYLQWNVLIEIICVVEVML